MCSSSIGQPQAECGSQQAGLSAERVDLDQSLINSLTYGDMRAFEKLYNLHKRRVYSLCRHMVEDAALAEDLTQEVFLLVFRKVHLFRGESAFTTWLHSIATNAVLTHLRYARSRGAMVSLETCESEENESKEDSVGRPDAVLSHSIDRIALERAISALPKGYRLVFLLHDVEGFEHQEIAELLGCSIGNTKSQLHKARLKLRRLLLYGAATLTPRRS